MEKLSTAEQQALRARAHGLNPIVMIGDKGLSETVLKEIDRSLAAHELVKIRVFSDERESRQMLLDDICERLEAVPIQHIGKILVVYRKRSDEVPKKTSALGRPTVGARQRGATGARTNSKPDTEKTTPSVRTRSATRRRKI